ncbi:hypothetical protein [Roseibium sp.]|uniref:hypothetical protein n=1 Tax=Roseibium sp. TaxID=1936156 RepID=UPI003A972968
MLRLTRFLLSALLLAASFTGAEAHGEHSPETLALGEFKIVNTGGFIEENGLRREMIIDTDIGTVKLTIGTDKKSLELDINGTQMSLFSMKNGLASFSWNPEDTNLLHHEDILDVSGKNSLEEVHAWAAKINWPDLGDVTLVMFNYDRTSYGGFLISKPEGKTIVRQMEFHRLSGPRHRANSTQSFATEHRR